MENELLRIKEDAIKIQEADISDTLRSIDAENTKSSFVLIFASVLIAFTKDFDKLPQFVNVIFLILTIAAIIFAFYNISAKRIRVHTNVDEIFVKNTPAEWGEYLNNKHLFLRNSYQEAKKLLYRKANLTKISFVLVVLSVILISVANILFMSEDQKSTKHIGEQQPINQNPKPGDGGGNTTGNNQSNSGNPLKPQETQKGVVLVGKKSP